VNDGWAGAREGGAGRPPRETPPASVSWGMFTTSIGRCGIAWDACGLAGVQLPERSERETRVRMRRRWPGGVDVLPPPEIRQVMDSVSALLRGEPVDLSGVPLNLNGIEAFNRRVYQIAREIPPGQVLTYGELAQRLGDQGTARAVGRALGQNPFPLIVPCHRVVAAGGQLGGFSGGAGRTTKRRLLEIEGAVLGEQPSLFDGFSP
jgi:methylated-DNA-[protein]-cysteine S-methyltransferase